MGPYLPDLRLPAPGRVGVRVEVGKTTAASAAQLVERYALIANRPASVEHQVVTAVRRLAVDAALRGAVVGLAPVVLWELLGPRRRHELLRPTDHGVAVATALAIVVAVAVIQPWDPEPEPVATDEWIPLPRVVPEIDVPPELADVEVQGGVLTTGTRRLVASAFQGYQESKVFYDRLVDRAPTLAGLLRQPAEGETVAVLVSDRHDNVGMDAVVRAVAEQAGATLVLDAGDDTSTGEAWEAFSIDSLADAFEDLDDKVMVAGNHDHGSFVAKAFADHGWTHLDGKPETVADIRMFGVDDPRSSGLGIWKDEKGLSFAEVEQRVADAVCKLDDDGERVATLLVHDRNLGREALDRGCTDLVLGGHLHVQVGPDRVVGSNGKAGYTYTNGTTGGAAYAVALGSRLRREAEISLVTYADGRPAGIQPVRIDTRGEYHVDPYVALDLGTP
jgi:hypothetical protein